MLELHVPPAPEERTTRIPIAGRETSQTVDVETGDPQSPPTETSAT